MKQLLKELVETPGVTGDEKKVRELIKEKVEPYADSIEEDALGNLIVRKGSGEKTLMLDAHMDQIGMAVERIDEEGFIRLTRVGGLFCTSMVNQQVTIHSSDGPVKGVIGMKPPHLEDEEERKKVPEEKELFIDIGGDENPEEYGVEKGDYVTIDQSFEELQEDYVTGPAFDDRTGCAVVIEALKRFDEDYELAAVFTIQEEVGTKGARTAAFGVDPDVALAVDVGISEDIPNVERGEAEGSLGDGVGIDLIQAKGRGLLTIQNVREWLIETAEDNEHEYFKSIYEGGGSDAMSINLVRDGVPAGSLTIATRNIHSPVEVAKMSDLETSVEFIEDCFETLPEHF